MLRLQLFSIQGFICLKTLLFCEFVWALHMSVCVYALHTSVYHMHAGASPSLKRALDSLELGLQMGVSHQVGTRN